MNNLLNWVIPNIFFQKDGGEGGDPPDPDPTIKEDEELELDPTSKLAEMELETIDQLFDREDVDGDKLLDWMKTRDEETTLETVLIKDEKDKKDTDDKTDTDDDDGKVETDLKDEEDKPGEDEEDKPGDQTDKKTDDKPDDKKDADDDQTGKMADQKPGEDKTGTKAFKITENYINRQVQNFRDQWKDDPPDVLNKKINAIQDILDGIKGSEMDQKSLKNYINAQLYIKTIRSPFDSDWKPDQKVVSDPKYIEEATKQKQKMIINKMKAKFPEFPDEAFDDDDALSEFEEGLSRRQYQEYDAFYKQTTGEIDNEYDRYVHITQNWESIAESTIRTDVALFKAKLARYNLTPKDIGIESLDLDDQLYNEYLWKNVIFQEGDTNKPNPDVLTFMDDVIPIVKPKEVYNNLMEINMDAIIAAKEHKARQQGFKTGLNNMEDPSTSNLPGKEHRDKVEIEVEDFDNDDLTPEQIQEKLDRIKNSIASGATGKSGRKTS